MTLPGPIPKDLTVLSHDDGTMTIQHRYQGNWQPVLILCVWIPGWSFFCWVATTRAISNLSEDKEVSIFDYLLIPIAVLMVVFLVIACGGLIWQLAGKTWIHLSPQELRLQFRPPVFRSKCIPRADIESIIQYGRIAETAKQRDPLWDLRIKTRQKTWAIHLIHQDKKDRSDWLGQVLADWAGIEMTVQVENYSTN